MRLEFGEFAVDLDRYELRRQGEPIRLEPKVFDVLRHLIVNRDRVVPKDELLCTLWPDEHVVEGVVTRCVYVLRQALGQEDANGPPLATVRGRGYRFTAQTRAAASSSASGHAEPFVGRSAEMARLRDALASARAGRGRIVWLSGDAGIGKTRLADEISDVARAEGVATWVARCHEHEGAPPFWLWTQVVRAGLEERPESEARRALGPGFDELAAIVPELGPARAGPTAADADAAPYRLFDAVTRFLRLATSRTPHLLVLDDVHWADAPSLRLLGFLAPELAGWSLCVVATAREDDWRADDPRRASLAQIALQRSFERVRPMPLGADAVREYVSQVLGRSSADVAEVLHRTSEGNAFFMVETLRGGSWDASGALDTRALPAAVKDVVARRLAGLSDETRDALRAAAVTGRTFGVQVVAHALGCDARAALAALEPAVEARLLTRTAEHHATLAFGHGLVREAVHAEIPPARRAMLHARVAEALERVEPPPLAEIARHFVQALPEGDPAKAVDYARRAGDAAGAVHAHDAAAAAYADALDALDHAQGRALAPAGAVPGTRHALLVARGQACCMAGRVGEAVDAFTLAADFARRAGRPLDLAHAAIGLRDCQSSRAVPDPAVWALLDEALHALPDDELSLRARLLSRMASVRAIETRRALSDEAAALVARAGDPAAEADVLRARLHALQGPDQIAERERVADALVALAERRREPAWSWEALLARYDAHLRRGEMREADLVLDRAGELADRLRHPLMRMEVDRHRAQRALCSGRYAEAEAGIKRTSRMAARLQSPFGRFYFSAQMLWLLRDKGLLHALEEEGERFIEQHPWAEVTARATVGVLYLERGERERARACFSYYANTGFDNVPYGEDFVSVGAQLAVLCAALDERAHAETLRAMLLPYADQNVVSGPLLYLGSAAHPVALLDASLGHDAAAREHFEAALAANERWDALPALFRTQEAYAAFLRGWGDASRADALAAAGRDLRSRLGLP